MPTFPTGTPWTACHSLAVHGGDDAGGRRSPAKLGALDATPAAMNPQVELPDRVDVMADQELVKVSIRRLLRSNEDVRASTRTWGAVFPHRVRTARTAWLCVPSEPSKTTLQSIAVGSRQAG